MRRATLVKLAIGLFLTPFLLSFPAPHQARAQESGYSDYYSPEELAQMLAPVALYPDALLSQILMASTYPIEVIEADRWIKRNPGLQGDALDTALLAKGWDPSVKAMCHFPSILALMSDRIAETTDIGNAFLAQEEEVMDTVQELRHRAYARGNLTSNSRQKVVVEQRTIVIEPANPRVVYVPYYDSLSVYGPWWYSDYPPYTWVPAGVRIGVGISYWPGFHFGFTYSSWSYFDWPRRIIFIDVHKRPRYVRHDRWIVKSGRWHHAPDHRRGVVYRHGSTARKYAPPPDRFREYRRDARTVSGRRDLDRKTDRRGVTRNHREITTPRHDGDRQKVQRIERERKNRDRTERQNRIVTPREKVEKKPARGAEPRERAKLVRDRQGRERFEDHEDRGERRIREQARRPHRPQQTIDGKQQQRRSGPDRQERESSGRRD